MNKQKTSFKSLAEYVDYLQSRGEYVFTQKAAREAVGCSEWGIRLAANKLIMKKRIVKLRYAFYLIVPLEYRVMGAPPPAWYIDSLMHHHRQPYYVALLSAAALYGAAHQQPQVFQVITNKSLRPIKVGRARVEFLVKRNLQECSMIRKQTETGYMNISTPEVTAFDLIKYVNHIGSLSRVATVLTELSETIDSEKLVAVARNEKIIIVQRLGYLLEKCGIQKIADRLHAWFLKQRARFVPLRTDQNCQNSLKNKEWKILINEKIEVDDI